MMLSCKQVSELMRLASVRKLTLTEKLSLKVHLLMCAVCRKIDSQMKFLKMVFKQLPEKIEEEDSMSDEAKEKIKQSLQIK
jgi:hypothetical protein